MLCTCRVYGVVHLFLVLALIRSFVGRLEIGRKMGK